MNGKTGKLYGEFMQALEFCAPPIVSYYSETLPGNYASPEGGFAIDIKSAGDLLACAGNIKKLNEKQKEFRCMFRYVRQTRKEGTPAVFDYDHFGCPGARFYMGFIPSLPRFNNHFISTGFPVIYQGERLAPSAASAEKHSRLLEGTKPKGKYLVFGRIDKLEPDIVPETVTFIANPEMITGLAALVRFVTDEMDAVQSPFTSGCSSIFTLPYRYAMQGEKKAVLGIFDPAARAYLHPGELTLSLPFTLFQEMLGAYKKSFMGITGKKRYLIKNAVPGWQEQKIRARKLKEL